MRRIWDTNAPDPSSLWRVANAPDTAGFSRRKHIANAFAATAPAPHSKTPRATPLVGQDARRINPPKRPGISFGKISAFKYSAFYRHDKFRIRASPATNPMIESSTEPATYTAAMLHCPRSHNSIVSSENAENVV